MGNDAAVAVRHAKIRWVGAPLLLSGVGLLGFAVSSVFAGGSLLTVGLGMFGCGLSLAAFGVNHDTAMALSFANRNGDLPEPLLDELKAELERDRDGIVHGRPTPKVALAMPLVAVSIQAWVAVRLFGGSL